MSNNFGENLKARAYADLSKSTVWTKYLKPYLEKEIEMVSKSVRMPENEFEAVKGDIQRATTVGNFVKIISMIEKSNDKTNQIKL